MTLFPSTVTAMRIDELFGCMFLFDDSIISVRFK